LKIVKQDLNKALNATVADFSEQARSIVRSLSCGLREDGEKTAEEARREFDVVVKGAAKELQNDLSRMREEVMRSHFSNARNVLAELRKSSVKYEEIQGVLHEVSMKVEDLEISVKAGCDNVADLDDQFKNQMALAQQSIGDINSLVVRVEGSIGDLEQRAQAAFEKARMIVEQQIPETTHQAIREGRLQALLYSRGETAKEIHLVLGGLYAELRMLERDMREKVETVKTMVEDQKKSIIATTQKSGGESLCKWVAEKLSS
jgi:gas vesicle protein